MIEKDIEKRLKNRVKAKNGMALKLISPGVAGMPDRILLFKESKISFVELKRPGKDLRALQIKRKQQLEDMGFKVYKIASYEEIDNVLEEMMK